MTVHSRQPAHRRGAYEARHTLLHGTSAPRHRAPDVSGGSGVRRSAVVLVSTVGIVGLATSPAFAACPDASGAGAFGPVVQQAGWSDQGARSGDDGDWNHTWRDSPDLRPATDPQTPDAEPNAAPAPRPAAEQPEPDQPEPDQPAPDQPAQAEAEAPAPSPPAQPKPAPSEPVQPEQPVQPQQPAQRQGEQPEPVDQPATSDAASTPAPSRESPASGGDVELNDYQSGILAATNAARVEAGAPPLQADPCAQQSAQSHADALQSSGAFDHQDLGPVLDSCQPASSVAENIARGDLEAEAMVQMWLNSPGHRANILNPALTHIGVGASGDGSTTGVQVFLSR